MTRLLAAAAALAVSIEIGLPTTGLAAASQQYTGAGYATGTLADVQVNASGALQLVKPTRTPDYFWMANYTAGTVLRVDVNTGAATTFDSVVVDACLSCGTVKTAWQPFSIAVDMDGNAWIVNRGKPSVTRLGASPTTIAIPSTQALNAGITVDEDGSVWVSGPGNGNNTTFYKVSPSSGVVQTFTVGIKSPIDSLVARSGWVYGVTSNKDKEVMRFQPATGAQGNATCAGAFALALDAIGTVWVARAGNAPAQGLARVTSFAGQASCSSTWNVAGGALTGIAIDGSSQIFAAGNLANAVYRFTSAGALAGTYPAPAGFINTWGVDVAGDGSIWVAGMHGYWKIGGSSTADPAMYSWTNSDMTGFQLRRWLMKGSWDVVQDAGTSGAVWGTVTWSGDAPAGTSVTAQVRAADRVDALPAAPWVAVTSGQPFHGAGVVGRYLELKLTLTGAGGTPVISSVQVETYGFPNGATCSSAADCASGSCVDGVCCNTACASSCEACGEEGSLGTCIAITGAPRNARRACTTDGSACGGSCDGITRDACSYPDGNTSCRQKSCTSGTETLAAVCTGAGTCDTEVKNSCNAYICGADACLTTCTGDAQCASTFLCDPDPKTGGATLACLPDLIPPTLALDSLPAYTNQPTRTISGSVKDRSPLASYGLTLNGVAVPITLAADGSFSVSVTLAEGPNTVTLSAQDVAGNAAASVERSTTLDTAPPVVAIVSPAAGKAFGSSLGIPFELSVSDASPFTVDAAGTKLIPGAVAGTVDVTGDEGPNSITFTVTDVAGNATAVTASIVLDFTAPVLTIDDLTPVPAATAAGTLPIILHVDDLTATTTTLSLNGSPVAGNPFLNARGGGLVSYAFGLVEGANSLSFTSLDEVRRDATLTRTVVYDRTPPTGSFTSPAADGAFVRGQIEAVVEATDNLTGVASIALGAATATGSPATFPIDTTALTDGPHELVAALVDGVGNAAAVKRTMVVDNTAPELTLATVPSTQFVKGTIEISVTAADATSGVARVEITVNGATTTCTASPCTPSFDTHALGQDGAFVIAAKAFDAAGNEVAGTVTRTAVNSAPIGFLTGPANSLTVTDAVTISVDASSDPYFRNVRCSIGGAEVVATTTEPKFTKGPFSVLGFLDGELEVACTATNVVDTATTERRTVRVKNWTETLNPTTLNLRTGGQSVVTLYVEGKNAALLVPIAGRQISLRLGNSSIQALAHPTSAAIGDYNANGIPDLTLKFDRQSLINVVKAAGARNTVTLEVWASGQKIGETSVQVNP